MLFGFLKDVELIEMIRDHIYVYNVSVYVYEHVGTIHICALYSNYGSFCFFEDFG